MDILPDQPVEELAHVCRQVWLMLFHLPLVGGQGQPLPVSDLRMQRVQSSGLFWTKALVQDMCSVLN